MRDPTPRRSSARHEWAGYAAIALGLGGLLWWSWSERIASAVIAGGMVQVEERRIAIQHADGGTVAALGVREGQKVKAGDLLVRLDSTFIEKEIALLSAQADEVATRRARLEAERDGSGDIDWPADLLARATTDPDLRNLMDSQRNLLLSRNDNVAKEIAQLDERAGQTRQQTDGLESRLAAVRRQLDLVTDELAGLETLLAKGLTTQDRVNALRRGRVQLEGQIGEVEASLAENRGRMAEIAIARLRVAGSNSERALTELREVEPKLAELRQSINTRQEVLSRTEMRAPVDGVVFGVQIAAAGAVVRPAEPVMYVIPGGSPLVVMTRIEPDKIDQVAEGQPATVIFTQFGRARTPELESRVTRLSSDIYVESETGRTYYQAEIALPGDKLALLEADGMRLIPGMPAEALIRTGERSPLSYLVKPLTDQLKFTWLER